MLRFLAAVGAAFLTFLTATGRLAVFAGMSVATAFTPPFSAIAEAAAKSSILSHKARLVL